MLITRRHGSWVVLGTLVTAAELEPTAPLRRGLRLLHPLHRRLPDRRARRAGRARRDPLPLLLDAGARADPASPTGRRSAPRSTAATSARTSAPGTAASSAAAPGCRPTRPPTSTCSAGSPTTSTGEADAARAALRPAQRPALAAAERARRAREHGAATTRRRCAALRRHAEGEDELLAEHARWALERLEATMQLRGVERWISLVRLIAFPFVVVAVALAETTRPAGRSGPGSRPPSSRPARSSLFLFARTRLGRRAPVRPEPRRPGLRHGDRHRRTCWSSPSSAACRSSRSSTSTSRRPACASGSPAGSCVALISAPIVAVFEKLRADQLHTAYSWKLVAFQTGFEVMMALIVGWLVRRLAIEAAQAEARAEEAERLHEIEQRTVAELRRLSALRADFVSLVSHEVRTPMAAVIGSARTLQQRWRELSLRAARRVPGADRRRDRPARRARRRGARQLADRRGDVQLHASASSTSPA